MKQTSTGFHSKTFCVYFHRAQRQAWTELWIIDSMGLIPWVADRLTVRLVITLSGGRVSSMVRIHMYLMITPASTVVLKQIID